MAKKKPRVNETKHKPEPSLAAPIADDSAANTKTEASPESSVIGEVQAFLAQRAELTKKLAEEIEATEKKLAELKRTAALLAPQAARTAPKEKKPKKASKPKTSESRAEPTAESAPSEATE